MQVNEMAAAKEKGVVTQLGNQGHSWDSIRMVVEWVKAGLIMLLKCPGLLRSASNAELTEPLYAMFSPQADQPDGI